MTAARARSRVAVMGLDNFSRKNRAQVEGLNRRGYHFDVFTNDALGDSGRNMPAGNSCTVLAPGPAARVAQVAAYLRRAAPSLNHVEAYPGGRFSFAYVLLAKLVGVPVVTVERGDLLYESRYDALTARAMRMCYRRADVVWYRELYQEAILRRIGARRLFFLENAVAVPPEPVPPPSARHTDFAWVNRLIAERKAAWVVDALAAPDLAHARTVMLGFMDDERVDAGTRANQRYVREHGGPNLEIGAYADPDAVLRTAKFFLLPSDIVFCNNALLEAMARGVIPLVSDVEGARRIVDDGVNGFVFPHTADGLAGVMRRAISLPADARARMSAAAVDKVRASFSAERWCDRLAAEYADVGARQRAGGAARLRPTGESARP